MWSNWLKFVALPTGWAVQSPHKHEGELWWHQNEGGWSCQQPAAATAQAEGRKLEPQVDVTSRMEECQTPRCKNSSVVQGLSMLYNVKKTSTKVKKNVSLVAVREPRIKDTLKADVLLSEILAVSFVSAKFQWASNQDQHKRRFLSPVFLKGAVLVGTLCWLNSPRWCVYWAKPASLWCLAWNMLFIFWYFSQ